MAKRWYVVHTYSGFENKVKNELERRIASFGLTKQVVDIKVPTETVTEIKDGGKRKTKETMVFPGYVLVRMEIDDDSWAVVRNTPGVTGFIGTDGKPSPLTRDEFNHIMRKTDQPTKDGAVQPRATINVAVGDSIRVTRGPLADFDGIVSEVNAESGKVKVTLMIFGRETPVELSVDQISISR